MYAFAGDPALD